ncbi:MAG: hypothetical protein ABIP75_12825 [Pyrinomonadaceae bacterium]
MKNAILLLALILLFNCFGSAQMPGMDMGGKGKPATLMSGLGNWHHPVSTRNALAQKFFDQGLRLIYAFNHEEAVRSFKRAAELDPKLAMAYWGVGYALGPNINLDVDPEREKAAYGATQQALKLAGNASPNERAYIDALATRYSLEPNADLKKLAVDFKIAMGELVKQFPNDLDAATLYAESAMNLRPWQLWASDGQPAEGTLEIIATLESVLKRNSSHVGAIHYYIHAVEASPHPERALKYVATLPAQMPAAGHLVHMPAHIYQRTGNYPGAVASNQDAIVADDAYIKLSGGGGMYPLMYYNHNLHFLAIASSMAGNYAESAKAADHLVRNVEPYLKQVPMLEGFVATSLLIQVRFHKWDEILALPQPDPTQLARTTVWRFSRAMAYAAKGDATQGQVEQQKFLEARAKIPAGATFGLNTASAVLAVAERVLNAHLALRRNATTTAIAELKLGIQAEDRLTYDEPPGWIQPVREMLGGVLLRSGDAAGAEVVFRADLLKNPKNGRSLFGLTESLKAQGKARTMRVARRQFVKAWKTADVKLNVAEL